MGKDLFAEMCMRKNGVSAIEAFDISKDRCFGNLEVSNDIAFSILVANIDSCSKTTVSNWKVGIDKGKYGPMGEDLFAEMCMRKNGVTAIEAFDLSKDGCCEAKRPGLKASFSGLAP